MTKRQFVDRVYSVEHLAQAINIQASCEIKREGVSWVTYKPSL